MVCRNGATASNESKSGVNVQRLTAPERILDRGNTALLVLHRIGCGPADNAFVGLIGVFLLKLQILARQLLALLQVLHRNFGSNSPDSHGVLHQ